MSWNKLEWHLKSQPSDAAIKKLQADYPCSRIFATLCLQRGLETAEEIQAYVSPSSSVFHDPYLLYDMERAVDRIHQALMDGEKITVYGDYDADGVTSTTLLVESLLILGGDVDYYIPNRFSEGYGPHPTAFEKLAQQGSQLILTCDNGVQGHEAIEVAASHGVDVIVTDHHELPEELPAAYAIVHPQHPQGDYPFKDLAGVGVAFKLACALLEDMPVEFLDLLAIGTVADLVALEDENRWLVKKGIEALKKTDRLGLLALYHIAGVQRESIDESTIGFQLAPRLNAAGRMADADQAVDLLLEQNPNLADEKAKALDQLNQDRKFLVDKITEEALEQASQLEDDILLLSANHWHEGIIGIVASRVVEKYHKPTLIFSRDDLTGWSKGSGRSIEGYHLFEALNEQSQYIEKFGGHEMAAGLTVANDQLEDLRQAMNSSKIHGLAEDHVGQVQIDVEIQVDDCQLDLIQEISQLGPFGTNNEAPMYLIKASPLTDVRQIGSDQSHLKMDLISNRKKVPAIAFGMGDLAASLESADTVDLIGHLDVNEWRQQKTAQFQVKDVTWSLAPVIDRRRQATDDLLKNEYLTLVYFDPAHYQSDQDKAWAKAESVLITSRKQAEDLSINTESIAYMDIPAHPQLLKDVLAETGIHQIILAYDLTNEDKNKRLPHRQELGHVYRYLSKHRQIKVGDKWQALASYLKIEGSLLKTILMIFYEASLIEINNDIIRIVDQAQRVDLEKLEIVKRLQLEIKTNHYLMTASAKQMKKYLFED